MPATAAVLDLTYAYLKENGKPAIDGKGRPPEKQGGRPPKGTESTNPKQIRRRARRRGRLLEEELEKLYKPIDEWDSEELAKGYPRSENGKFSGSKPSYINRAMHEQIVQRFEQVVKQQMNEKTVAALDVLTQVMDNDDTDMKGKPIVPASTKVDVAKFLLEHVIGKPKQRVETDISVKLQGLLGVAMVNPNGQLTAGYSATDINKDILDVEAIEDDYDTGVWADDPEEEDE